MAVSPQGGWAGMVINVADGGKRWWPSLAVQGGVPSGYGAARQTSLPRGPGEERTADSRERQRLSPQTDLWAQAAGTGTDVGGKKGEARR